MSENTNPEYELLLIKEIAAILYGDTKLGNLQIGGNETEIMVSMPYLSGPKLCEISTKFGLPVSYSWGVGVEVLAAMNISRIC